MSFQGSGSGCPSSGNPNAPGTVLSRDDAVIYSQYLHDRVSARLAQANWNHDELERRISRAKAEKDRKKDEFDLTWRAMNNMWKAGPGAQYRFEYEVFMNRKSNEIIWYELCKEDSDKVITELTGHVQSVNNMIAAIRQAGQSGQSGQSQQ